MRLKHSHFRCIAAMIVAALPTAWCQNPSAANTPIPQSRDVRAPTPVFDVAAIHQNVADRTGHSHIISSAHDGKFTSINVPLRALIRWAYEMPETRILGGPAWTDTTKFDIEARADSAVDAQLHALDSDAGKLQKERMLRALLADRFKLVTHTETRQLPIYALVVAKGGPRMGPVQSNGTTVNSGNGHIEVQASNSVPILAEQLANVVGRVVVDNTGIAGRYDLVLKWTPEDRADAGFNGGGTAQDSGPSIFTALQEQLGLKLEPQKGPVEVLVIDRIEMPSEN